MMEKIREQLQNVQLAFGRLTQQDQLRVVAGGVASLFLILLIIGYSVSSAIDKTQRRVRVKNEQLQEVLRLQGEYRAKQTERETRIRNLGRQNIRLVSVIEEVAKQAGVEIGQLRQTDGEPDSEGIVESRVDLRASGLSADRLEDFLRRIENVQGLVVVRRLKLERPFRRDTLDAELSISTFRAST